MSKMAMVKIIEIVLHLNQHVEPDSRCGRQSQQRVSFALSLLHTQPRLHDFNALIPLYQEMDTYQGSIHVVTNVQSLSYGHSLFQNSLIIQSVFGQCPV